MKTKMIFKYIFIFNKMIFRIFLNLRCRRKPYSSLFLQPSTLMQFQRKPYEK